MHVKINIKENLSGLKLDRWIEEQKEEIDLYIVLKNKNFLFLLFHVKNLIRALDFDFVIIAQWFTKILCNPFQ